MVFKSNAAVKVDAAPMPFRRATVAAPAQNTELVSAQQQKRQPDQYDALRQYQATQQQLQQ